MKQKLLLLFLALLTTITASAYDFAIDNEDGVTIFYDKNSDGSSVTVVSLANKEYYGSVNIPTTVTYAGTTYSVTSIGRSAFYGCTGLTSVTIPNSVTSIGRGAFYGCTGLTSVTIPNSVTSIGIGTFADCTGLTSVTIPNSVTTIDGETFNGCSKLTSVTIPNSVTTIYYRAFRYCTGLTSVNIPESVTWIDPDAFYDCTGLIKSAYPSGLSNPFENGVAIKYPRDNNIIENGEIYSADKSAIYFIPLDANGEFTIPESVTSIGENAFKGCTGLTQINALLETAPNEFENSFEDVYSNATLVIPAGALQSYLKTDYWYLFESIKTNEGNISKINDDVFSYITDSQTKEATLTAINDKTMSTVTIPSRVVIEDGDETMFYQVTAIGQSAFKGMTSLTSIKLPANLTAIYNDAFNGCTHLTEITYPSKVSFIGNSAFQNCSNLASVTFPAGVISIGDKAFYNCRSLAEINAINATTIGASAFDSSKIKEVNLTAKSIGDNCFKTCWSLASANVNCQEIGGGAFYDCKNLTSYDFSTVKTIGSEAFYGTRLTEAIITPCVKSVGDKAFENCKSLKTFVIQDGTEPIDLGNSIVSDSPIKNLYIGRSCKGNALASSSMTALVIGNAVTELPEGAFQNSTSLKKVQIGSMLEAIPAKAFKGCTALTGIVVPRNVAIIGTNAFDGCKAIGNISIGCGTTEIGELAFNEVNSAAAVCVAAVNPPSANNNSFSNYNVPLYVPAESTEAYYNYPRCWYRFEPDAMKVISEVTIDGDGAIADMKVGETIKLVAAFEPADATLPYIFWRSTNPEIATVDNEGNVTFLGGIDNADEKSSMSRAQVECEIIAETLYADAPVASVKISGSQTGLNVIVNDSSNNLDNGTQRPNDIYNIQGICLKRNASQADINALSPGLYIIAGKKVMIK